MSVSAVVSADPPVAALPDSGSLFFPLPRYSVRAVLAERRLLRLLLLKARRLLLLATGAAFSAPSTVRFPPSVR